MRSVRCKPYHQPRGRSDPGLSRSVADRKSRCPSWASDPILQSKLIAEAIPDPQAATDSFGRPKVIWNGIAGWIFIGVSTNEQQETYNCYPNEPATGLHAELSRRAERTIESFLDNGVAS